MTRRAGAGAWRRFAIAGGAPPEGLPPWSALYRDGLLLRVARRLGRPVPEAFTAFATATRAANIVRLRDLHEVAATLATSGVDCVAVKGAARLVVAPACVATRPMSDLDLLVAPRDYADAVAALEQSGFRAIDERRPVSSSWTCEVELRRQRGSFTTAIDLHRGLHHGPVWRELAEGVLDRARVVGGVSVPSPVDALLIIAAHRTRHDFRGDLREVGDAWELLAALSEEEAAGLVQQAGAAQLGGALWALLYELASITSLPDAVEAARARLDGAVPAAFRRRLARRITHPQWTLSAREGQAPGFASMYAPLVLAGVPVVDAARSAGTHALLRAADGAVNRLRRN